MGRRGAIKRFAPGRSICFYSFSIPHLLPDWQEKAGISVQKYDEMEKHGVRLVTLVRRAAYLCQRGGIFVEDEYLLRYYYEKCLYAKYYQVENAGSYATERQCGTLYLMFEKSNGLEDWVNNFDFPAKLHCDSGTLWFCHRGFLRVWESIRPHIEHEVRDPAVKKIVLIGYSHGAAIATLAHEWVWAVRPDLREVLYGYGFGCPRVYWGFWLRQDLRRRWIHFTPVRNLSDIVTHVPPVLFGFRHVHRVLNIGRRGLYSPIDAHRPESYIAQLTAYEEKLQASGHSALSAHGLWLL